MNQNQYRIPKTGEGWRHYKQEYKNLYTIVGIAKDDKGFLNVVYTYYNWPFSQLPELFVQRLNRFLQDVEVEQVVAGAPRHVPRFRFESDAGFDTKCPFIPH